jgi:hypothetical protein
MTVRTLQTAFLLAAMAGLLPHALGQAGKRHEWNGANVDSNAFSRDGSSRLSADEKKQVAEWVNKLGDQKYRVRQQASDSLMKVGESITDILECLINDPDPEIQFRAREVYRVFAEPFPADTPVADLTFHADVGWGRFLLMLGPLVAEDCLDLPTYLVRTPKPDSDSRASTPTVATGSRKTRPVLRPGQTPCLMIHDPGDGSPLPLWFGPAKVVLPPSIRTEPINVSVRWEPYCLIGELDDRWQPTTEKARARVAAVAHFLRLGGSVRQSLIPRVPVPAWVSVLEERSAREDHEATTDLLLLGAAVPKERVAQALSLRHYWVMDVLMREADPTPYVSAISGALNGRLDHDSALLGLLARAGVATHINGDAYAKTIASGDCELAYYLLICLRRFGQPLPDDLLDALIRRQGHGLEICGPLLSKAQQARVEKLAADESQSRRVRFNAHGVLFYAGDDERWWLMREMITRADWFGTSYNPEQEEEVFGYLLTKAVQSGRPQRAVDECLTKHIAENDGGTVFWTWPVAGFAKAALTTLQQHPDHSLIRGLTRLRFQPAVDGIMQLMEEWDPCANYPGHYWSGCSLLREMAEPRTGPFVAEQLERLRSLTGSEVQCTRPLLVETLARMGKDYPAGQPVLARIANDEPPYSRLRDLALLGLHRCGDTDALPKLRKELMEAPPSLTGQLLRIYSHTGAPDARALLRDHLTHRYRPVRMAAAISLVRLGDGAGLPGVYAERFCIASLDNMDDVQETLWRYWQQNPPEAEVRMLETCFALWLQCSPAGARRLYREQRGTGEPLSPPWG